MGDLWKAVAELATSMHGDRVEAVADAISRMDVVWQFDKARTAFGPNADQTSIDDLVAAWRASPETKPAEVASAFRAAAHAVASMDERGSLELVWTGPKTGLIPTRRTEQVILEVIGSARSELFLVTYVFYKATSIIDGLRTAVTRGADVRILLESSTDEGGAIRGDSVKTMRESVPGAKIYVWDPAAKAPDGGAASAAVHAKCAVADRKMAFITSANLTSAALERNMELGLLIRGGSVPESLQDHLNALITTKVIKEWR